MDNKDKLAFTKKNYIIMAVGIGIILFALLIMSMDTEDYGLGFLGITLSPILLALGFGIEFLAIMKKFN